MLKPINLFLLLYLINQSINEGVNFELACTNIYYASKKDCSVAPWSNNRRCCYINYEYNGKKEGECGWVYDSEDGLDEKKREYNREGKSKVKIECYCNYIGKNINFFLLIFFIFCFL